MHSIEWWNMKGKKFKIWNSKQEISEERRREVEESDNDRTYKEDNDRTYKEMISICWNIGKR